jgi:hypothetical protein
MVDKGDAAAQGPWALKTPPDPARDLRFHHGARAIEDLDAMLKAHGDWMELGSADESKETKPGTVEA